MANMNNTQAKELFKKNIKSVEIGIHNFCNRTCTFCPLSRDDVDRKNPKKIIYMDKIMFQSIMEQLSEIDFDGRIDFSRYHEPLSDRRTIVDKIRLTNYFLPNAEISINTNSDYLKRDYLDELLDVGVTHLAIQAYLKNGVVASIYLKRRKTHIDKCHFKGSSGATFEKFFKKCASTSGKHQSKI